MTTWAISSKLAGVPLSQLSHGTLREPQLGQQSKHRSNPQKRWGRVDHGLQANQSYPRRCKNHQQITSNTTSTENEGTHLPLPKCLHKGKKHPRQLPLRQKYCAALEEASTTTFFTSKILCSASIVTGHLRYSSSSTSQKPLTMCSGTTCLL